MDAQLFERWFVIADQDHDGLVSGSEAVEFFTRSNLGQETLFQVPIQSSSLSYSMKRVQQQSDIPSAFASRYFNIAAVMLLCCWPLFYA